MATRKRSLTPADLRAAEKLKALWKAYQQQHPGVSQEVAAARAGMTQSAFSQFLLGRVPMRITPVVKLAKLFEVPPHAIRDDLPEMTYSRVQNAPPLELREPGPLSEDALEIAKVFDRLTPQTRDLVREQVFLYALVDIKYPWLRRGRPKGESYNQFERRAEQNMAATIVLESARKARSKQHS